MPDGISGYGRGADGVKNLCGENAKSIGYVPDGIPGYGREAEGAKDLFGKK